MRKNNDGYVLPFVLVVMIVLCIISTSLMTGALMNLRIQQRFTDQMVDKYEAQGKIEKTVAKLTRTVIEPENLTPDAISNAFAAWDVFAASDNGVEFLDVTGVAQEGTAILEDGDIDADKPFDITISLTASSTDTTINYHIVLTAECTSSQENPTYAIKITDITYQSYEISTGGSE